ncbi:hypothetical protein N836_29075 [Leptolyngbya sp. Heron Island J]|nr:hypothetical protein N836_29075 [Leptolyngbya sp. Heron Island J]
MMIGKTTMIEVLFATTVIDASLGFTELLSINRDI